MAGTQPIATPQDAALQETERDMKYYAARRAELLRQYPNLWVAIHSQRVVAAAPEIEQLFAELRSHGVAAEEALIQRLTDEEEVLILATDSR